MFSIDSTIQKIAEQGVLGIFLVISLFANGYLFKLVAKLQEQRYSDGEKHYSDSIEREKTVTIALHTVTDKLEAVDGDLKSLIVTVEKQ